MRTTYVVGGLYGNRDALGTVLAMAQRERGDVLLIFNGDFNWLNVRAEDFAQINETVLRHVATRGNVEAELATEESDAGCGQARLVINNGSAGMPNFAGTCFGVITRISADERIPEGSLYGCQLDGSLKSHMERFDDSFSPSARAPSKGVQRGSDYRFFSAF